MHQRWRVITSVILVFPSAPATRCEWVMLAAHTSCLQFRRVIFYCVDWKWCVRNLCVPGPPEGSDAVAKDCLLRLRARGEDGYLKQHQKNCEREHDADCSRRVVARISDHVLRGYRRWRGDGVWIRAEKRGRLDFRHELHEDVFFERLRENGEYVSVNGSHWCARGGGDPYLGSQYCTSLRLGRVWVTFGCRLQSRSSITQQKR